MLPSFTAQCAAFWVLAVGPWAERQQQQHQLLTTTTNTRCFRACLLAAAAMAGAGVAASAAAAAAALKRASSSVQIDAGSAAPNDRLFEATGTRARSVRVCVFFFAIRINITRPHFVYARPQSIRRRVPETATPAVCLSTC